MNDIILDKKYVLHIPLSKYVDGKVEEIDVGDFLDELISYLDVDGYYVTDVRSFYKSREYEEMLVTIFSTNDSVEEIFRQCFLKYNDVLCQEAFAYEVDNRMIIVPL